MTPTPSRRLSAYYPIVGETLLLLSAWILMAWGHDVVVAVIRSLT